MARGSNQICRRAASGRRIRVSDTQLNILIAYMEQHPYFARGQITRLGPQGHLKYKSMWAFLTDELNRHGPSVRDVRGWQNFWTKSRLTAKTNKASFLRALQKTGHNAVTNTLSSTDERISNIYGKSGTGCNCIDELGFNFSKSGASGDSSMEFDEEELFQFLTEIPQAFDKITENVLKGLEDLEFFNGARGSRPTTRQIEELVAFMLENLDLARENIENQETVDDLWDDVTALLNSIDGGCTKVRRAWMRTWTDLVGAARQNLKLLQTGGRLLQIASHHIAILQIMGDLPWDGSRPATLQQQASQPQARQSQALQPQAPQPQAPQPQAPQPQAPQPQAPQPQAPQPQAPQPRMSQPQTPQISSSSVAHPTMARQPEKRKPTYCGFEDLIKTSFPNWSTPSSEPLQKRVKLTFNSPSPTPSPIPSTSTATPTQKTSSAAEKGSKLIQQLETKATALMEMIFVRFQEALDLQIAMITSLIENQNRILMEYLPTLIRGIVSEEVINGMQQGLRQENAESAETAAIDEPADSAGFDDQAYDAAYADPASPTDHAHPQWTENAFKNEDEPEISVQEFVVGDDDEVTQDENCIICHEKVKNARKLHCGHEYCRSCLKRWMEKSENCPMCRRPVDFVSEIDGILTFVLDSDSD